MSKKFSKAKLNKFYKIFSEQRAEIFAAFKKKQGSNDEVDVDGDDVDLIQGAVLHGISESLSKRDIDKIKKLDIALLKIQEGTFGECTGCESPIGEKRLLASPGCELCISCAEDEEKSAREYNIAARNHI